MEIKDGGILDNFAKQDEKVSAASLIDYKSQEGKNIVYLFLFHLHH